MTTEKTKQEFETWFLANYSWFIENRKDGYSLTRCADEPFQYVEAIPHHDFRVWKASREAVKISLPSHQRIFLFAYTGQEVRGICIDELQAAGVAVESLGLESST